MFGGNVQPNKGGGGRTYQGGGGVQIPWADVGPVRLQLDIIPTQHQEFTSGVGSDWGVATEVGGGAGSLGKKLPCGSSGGVIVWSRDMGALSPMM